MIYLIIAVIFSSLVSIFMRLSESKCQSTGGMFMSNYLICMILSLFYIKEGNPFTYTQGTNIALGIGAITGILYLTNFIFLQFNIKKNGIVLASIFMKLGVVVPVLMAIILFKEMPRMNHIVGILLAILAIIVINYEKNSEQKQGGKWFLLILLLGSGIADSMMNIYDKVGVASQSDKFLFYIFAAAFICSIILYFVKKEKLCKWDLIFGALIGIPNYFASRFLLRALNDVSAVIVYPVYSIGAIVVICLAGVLFFKESLSRKKILGLLIVFAALVLLNI